MAKKDIIQRTAGNQTRNAIINAARVLFPASGFSGTSLTQIAEMAQVNKSLILHHFKTKENLWKLVKASFLEAVPEFELLPDNDDIAGFIKCVVTRRFALYDKNPAMARMISHQRLEDNATNLEGTGNNCFEQFVTVIKKFQAAGQIRKNLDPELVSLWIAVSISGIFLIREKPFKNKKQKQMYQNMIIESILTTISSDCIN